MPMAEAGRQVGGDARAPPAGGNGGKARARARRRPNRMCARRTGEGRACPSPEAAHTAAVRPTARLYGPGLASAAARRPPGPPLPPRARPGAPPLGLAAYALRTREGGHGPAGRAVRASQVVSPSRRPGRRGRAAPEPSAPRVPRS